MPTKEPATILFRPVKSRTRRYGYAIQAPPDVTWVLGAENTFGWYRRKRDAQQRCDELNRVREYQLNRARELRTNP